MDRPRLHPSRLQQGGWSQGWSLTRALLGGYEGFRDWPVVGVVAMAILQGLNLRLYTKKILYNMYMYVKIFTNVESAIMHIIKINAREVQILNGYNIIDLVSEY